MCGLRPHWTCEKKKKSIWMYKYPPHLCPSTFSLSVQIIAKHYKYQTHYLYFTCRRETRRFLTSPLVSSSISASRSRSCTGDQKICYMTTIMHYFITNNISITHRNEHFIVSIMSHQKIMPLYNSWYHKKYLYLIKAYLAYMPLCNSKYPVKEKISIL